MGEYENNLITPEQQRIEELERTCAEKVIPLIDQEIAWCKANRGSSGESPDFENGFIKGLEQAKLFTNKVAHSI